MVLLQEGTHRSRWGNNGQEGKNWSAKVGTKSRFPCFPPLLSPPKKGLATHSLHTKWDMGVTVIAAAPTGLWSWCSLGKAFFTLQCVLLPEARASMSCWTCDLAAALLWSHRCSGTQKDPKSQWHLAVHTQNPQGDSRCPAEALLSSLGRRNTNWSLPSKMMHEQSMQDTVRFISKCSQHPQRGLILCPTPSIGGFQGQQAPK